MSDVNANIGIQFDTATALAQLRQLQAGLSKFNQSLTEGNVAAANAQKGLNAQLVQSINSTGKFVASQKTIASSTTAFTDALEKNKLSMTQYFKFTGAAATMNSKMLQGFFSKEKEILTRASKDRVKALQTQYVQLTNANGELVKVLQVVPKHLNMVNGQYADYATRTQMAAQRQQFLNQLIKQGSTQLLNFGKNTQWAGRQLMVGLTIPLTMLGSVAARTFRDMEMAVVSFTRVYGDMTTGIADTDKAVESIQRLAKEFTKFGITATDTVNMAAKAAAMGLTGSALTAQVTEATRLAVLGQVEQQQALETTISLQNAFGISAEQLAQKINFLNAVENQTVLSIEDLTIAIPKAGPVIKQLGGSVEDLAFFMTAMKEGGINASEGANALKSGLASIINPSKKASDFLASLGINIKGIADANAGNLKGTIVGVAQALDTLAPLQRSRAIEQLFGKFQFARISTLFQNITKEGSQASKAFQLAGASVEELAILSERELGKVENAVGVKFQKQIENLKLQLIPIGKAFLEAVTPIVEFAGKILEKFNNLSDGTKKFVVGLIAVLGGIAPVALMTVGLVANGVANLMKFFGMLRGGMAKLNGQNNVLGGGFDYLTQKEIENLAESQALHTSHKDLISTFNVEATSVNALATAYANAASQARSLATASPGLFNTVPGASGAVSGLPKKFSSGGIVPGTGSGDTVPSMLTPGEVVLTKDTVKQNPEIVAALMNGNVQKFANGGIAGGSVPGYLQKEFDRISSLSDANLRRYAELTGMGVESTMDEIRKAVLQNFEELLVEVKAKTGALTQEGLTKIGKTPGAGGGPSIMGKWFSKFDEAEGGSFAHVGQTEKISSTAAAQLSVAPEVAKQMEIVKKYYEAKGQKAPDVRVADAFGFTMKQSVNRGMANKNQSRFQEKYGKTVGQAFQDDFAKTGAEKWRTMTNIVGADFDKIKNQAEIYDKALLAKITAWNTENAKKAIPDPFTDDIFNNLESQVRADIDGLIPDFKEVINTAKRTITALRTSIGKEDIGPINKQLKAAGAGTLGPKGSNAKYGNTEARTASEVLGTIESVPESVDKSMSKAELVAETKSPSERMRRLGKNIGKGLENGLAESINGVKSQSDKLVKAAGPSKSQSKVNTGDKAYFDRLNTPETMEERQNIKAMDRHWRKEAKKNKVKTTTASQTESMTFEQEDAEEVRLLRRKVTTQLKGSVVAASKARKADIEAAAAAEATAVSQTRVANTAEQIANTTDNTATSSVAVMQAEQSKATTSSLTVSALEQEHQSILSGTQSASATSDNLQTSETLTEKINQSEQERLASAQESADIQQRIEKKLAQEEIEYQAWAASLKTPQIPGGSQTGQGFINPLTAMSKKDAMEEAASYTRDKNGQILIDPETKNPTTLSKWGLNKKVAGMRAAKVGKFSGKAAGGLGTAAMVAGMAGAPPQVTAALGVAATAAQFAPMLTQAGSLIAATGPIGVAAAGIVALGVASKVLDERFKAMARAQVTYIKSISATTEKMKKMGAITGKVGSSEIMAKRRAEGLNDKYTEVKPDGTTFGVNFLGDKMGKEMVKSFSDNMKKVGAPQAAEDLSLELASYISDGVLSAEQANSIARAIGVNLKNTKIGIDIQGNLLQLVGPDGEDLKNNPIGGRTKLLAKSELRAQRAMGAMNAQGTGVGSIAGGALAGGMLLGGPSGAIIGAGLGYAFQQNRGTKEAAQVAALDAQNIGFAQAQADAVAREYSDRIRVLEAQKAATTDKAKQLKIQQDIAALTKEEADAASKMNLQVAISMDNALKRFDQIQMGNIGRDFNQTLETLTLGLVETNAGNKQDAYFEALKSSVTDKYKGTGEESAAERVTKRTQTFDNVTSGTGFGGFLGKWTGIDSGPLADIGVNAKTGFTGGRAEAQRFEAQIDLLMANGLMTPSQTETMLDLFDGKLANLKSVLDFGIKTHGAAKTTELIQMLSGFKDKKLARSVITNITAKNPAQFDKLSSTINKLAQLDGTVINMEAVIKTIGMSGLISMQKSLDAIEGIPDPITKEAIVKLDKTDATDFSKVTENWDYFEKLDPTVRKEAIQTYTTLFRSHATEDAAARQIWNEQWAKNKAIEESGQFQGAKYEQSYQTNLIVATKFTTQEQSIQETKDMFRPKTGIDVNPAKGLGGGGGGGKADDPLSFLDSLAMRIKMIRDESFNARKPVESLLKAFTSKAAQKDAAKMITLFEGIQQKLIALKAPKEFRDYIAGLSAEEFDKLKNLTGKKAMFTFGKDKNGKIDKNNITGFTEFGKSVMAGYREAPIAEFNAGQREILENTKNQFTAFTKLKAAGLSSADALAAVEDTAVAASIASGQLSDPEEMKTYIADINRANTALEKQTVITELLKKNADFEFAANGAPKLASALSAAGMSSETIKEVLSDPNLAKQLIDDLSDGKIDSEAIATYLGNLEDQKFIEIKTNFSAGDFAAAAAPGMELVNKMFSMQEALLRTGVSDLTKDIVENIDILKDDNIWMQEEIQRIQVEELMGLENRLAEAQRNIEMTITRKIEEYQKQIDTIQRNIEIKFDRPLQEIQDRNSVLSHDMDVMAHAAEQINEKYDNQLEALDAVERVNQRILRQQQQQIGLADALSQGDIAAAARAAQEMRSANAAEVATSTREALQQAKQTELDAQTGGVSGLTRKQIAEEQYQNSQKMYALEQARAEQQLIIRNLQDQIFAKEEERKLAQVGITAIEDEIFTKQKTIKDYQDTMAINDLAITQGERQIQTQVDILTVLGETKDTWDKISTKIDASALAGEEFDKTMGAMLASVDKIDESWGSILDKLDSVSNVTDQMETTRSDLIASTADVVAPTIEPNSAADNFDTEYNDTSKSLYADANAGLVKQIKADSKITATTPTKTNNTGGGNNDKTDNTTSGVTPGSASKNAPGSANYKAGSFQYVPVKANTKASATKSDKAIIPSLSFAGIKEEKANAQKVVTDLQASITKLGAKPTKVKSDGSIDFLSGLGPVASENKDKARQLIAKYDEAYKYLYGFSHAGTANRLILNEKELPTTNSALKYVEEQFNSMSAPMKEQFEILKMSFSQFTMDKKNYEIANKALTALKTTHGYAKDATDADFKKETNKEIRTALLTAWDKVAVEKGKMRDRNILVDNARKVIKAAGFTNENARWALTGSHISTTTALNDNKTSPIDSLAIANWTGYASGGLIPASLSSKRFSIGTDTVPAMLTPGEFIMSRYAVNSVGVDNLRAINSGAQIGDSVYNYNLSVNVRSDANPDDIARTVMAQIKNIDSQRIRGVRA